MRAEQLVSEKLAQDFFRKIAMADDPHDVINKLMLQKGPEGDAIRDIYNDVSVDHGLHPDDDFEEIMDFMVQDFEDMQPAESVEEDCGCEAVTEEEGHPKELLMKVVQQMQDDAAMGDYTAIDDLLKDIPEQTLRGFLSQVEDVQEQEDEEYDPRRVKADVVKHLVNMYNDAKKDGGYSSEKMHFALGNLLHDMDMAGYMNSDYFDIEGFFHKGIAKKQDYKVSMDMLRRAIKQAKGLDTDTSVDPAVFKRGGSAMKSHATESKSMLGEVVKELTEEEFDEAAGKKDACYRKVKSRYKVWPSAYASGALVQCRKVGAANWGNKSKK